MTKNIMAGNIKENPTFKTGKPEVNVSSVKFKAIPE